MKESFIKISDMELVLSYTRMETLTRVASTKVKLMEMGFTNGVTENFTTENGGMDSKMVMACGRESMAIATSASGKTLKQMVMECMFGAMAIDTRANGVADSNLVKEQIFLEMETCMLESIRMENLMDMDNILGQTEAIMLESSKVDLSMVKGSGEEVKRITPTSMKVNIQMIKSEDMESLLGLLGMCIKEVIKMMKEKGLE